MPTAVKFIQATMVLTAINEHTVNTKTGKSTHVRDFSHVEISFFFLAASLRVPSNGAIFGPTRELV
jgi:hypothetical protein